MDIKAATKALGALAQETRLGAFRLLVHAGLDGMPAGKIARALAVPQNTMSAHLSVLANTGLVSSRRQGRSIFYRIDLDGTRALLSFLMEDCCRGQPAVCAPFLDQILPACCDPSEKGSLGETPAH